MNRLVLTSLLFVCALQAAPVIGVPHIAENPLTTNSLALAPADGWFLVLSNGVPVWAINGATLTNITGAGGGGGQWITNAQSQLVPSGAQVVDLTNGAYSVSPVGNTTLAFLSITNINGDGQVYNWWFTGSTNSDGSVNWTMDEGWNINKGNKPIGTNGTLHFFKESREVAGGQHLQTWNYEATDGTNSFLPVQIGYYNFPGEALFNTIQENYNFNTMLYTLPNQPAVSLYLVTLSTNTVLSEYVNFGRVQFDKGGDEISFLDSGSGYQNFINWDAVNKRVNIGNSGIQSLQFNTDSWYPNNSGIGLQNLPGYEPKWLVTANGGITAGGLTDPGAGLVQATNYFNFLNSTIMPVMTGTSTALISSNKVLYFVTATKTNLVSDGR